MAEILTVAVAVILVTIFLLATFWRNIRCQGELPVGIYTFLAILFTSGLDVGLIMFPLVDYKLFATEAVYAFTNPLALEFGFWCVLGWGFYFLTTFYFCVLEPKLKLFEIPMIKWVNDLVILGTCGFTAYLFFFFLPDYVPGISLPMRIALLGVVILLAAVSSTHIRYVKLLSVASTWLFFALIAGLWFRSGMGLGGLLDTATSLRGFFEHLHRFVTPISDYHQFYLYWWFTWSIMIGQFVSRFVGGIKTWQLLTALLIVPAIPMALWFTVLYYYFNNGIVMNDFWRFAMVFVGVVFVINSLDSLIRLYTRNVGITMDRLGTFSYIAANWLLLAALVWLYQYTPMQIEWFGLVVVGIYAAIYWLVYQRRRLLTTGAASVSASAN